MYSETKKDSKNKYTGDKLYLVYIMRNPVSKTDFFNIFLSNIWEGGNEGPTRTDLIFSPKNGWGRAGRIL